MLSCSRVSTMGTTYACPQATYLFLCFPQPFRRNLFEFVEPRDGLYHASYVTLGELGANSTLGESQCSWARCLGLLLSRAREVCLAEEGTVPALGVTVTSQGAPWHTRNQHIHLHLVPAALNLPGLRASQLPSHSCCGGEQLLILKKKPKNQNAGVRRLAEELSL